MTNPKIESFTKAIERFREILNLPDDAVNRDSAIQRFEFTVELAWKSIQARLHEEGIECRSPKSCLQEAFLFGLVKDDPLWARMLEDRNLTSHSYDDELSRRIYGALKDYLPLLTALHAALIKLG